jgi:hypothetical protein
MEHKVTLHMDGNGTFTGWCECGDSSPMMWTRQDALVYAAFHLAVVGVITIAGAMLPVETSL